MGRTVLYASSPRDSSILNLVICIAGIYTCYLSYGIFQEKMYAPNSSSYKKPLLTFTTVRTASRTALQVATSSRPRSSCCSYSA
jgi:hypothetical protein